VDNAVADEMTCPWPSEEIPDDHLLYMRVFHQMVKGEHVSLSVFKNAPTPQDGMSTNWAKYSTLAQTREGARHPASAYRVVKMVVGVVRQIPGQTVEHTPDWENKNRAHTDVWGDKDDEEVRVLFGRAASLIPLNEME
jgi:tRNA/tmRNA/rRNA uracil-C5-methylase (TrmA/RlmC/RlmD family)